MLDEYAKVIFALLEAATLISIDEHLAKLPPKERMIEENRLAFMGYNVGNDDANDTNTIKQILGA